MVFSTINFIYTVTVKPLVGRQENRIEIFNELCILLCAHTFNIFINNALPFEVRYSLGWVFVGFAVINITGNMAITIKESLADIFSSTKEKIDNFKVDRVVSKRM